MKTWAKIAWVTGLTLLPVAGVVVYGLTVKTEETADGGNGSPGSYKEIDWRTLRALDFKTGQKPTELAALDGQYVKIPGFVVPLDDDATSYSEFLLVPSPQACVHVPPPPPNQMIMVRMKGSKAPQRSWGPIWLMGRLHIATTDSQYGKISYMLHGDAAEPYKVPDDPLPPPKGG